MANAIHLSQFGISQTCLVVAVASKTGKDVSNLGLPPERKHGGVSKIEGIKSNVHIASGYREMLCIHPVYDLRSTDARIIAEQFKYSEQNKVFGWGLYLWAFETFRSDLGGN